MKINTPFRYVSLIFAAYSFIYFSMQRTETAYKLATVGGSLSLFMVFLLNFQRVYELFIPYSGPYHIGIFVLMTYAFFFSGYALYHFSMKFQKGRDEKTLVLDGVTVLASLATFLINFESGLMSIFFFLMVLVGALYYRWRSLVRAFKN